MIWLDTAGLRPSASAVEAAGIERTRQLMHEADAVVLVLDASDTSASASSLTGLGEGPVPACVALNKTDVASSVDDIRRALQAVWQGRAITISALQRTGLDTLCNAVLTSAGRALDMLELPATFTTRQAALLQAAAENDHNILHTMLLQLIGSAPDQANPVADWPA